MNLNKVVLAGHLTATPELRQTPNGVSVTSFSIAINRRFSRNAEGGQAQANVDFVNCVAWRNTADFITRYFKKGSAICVTGSIQTRSWTANDGSKRYATEVVADEATFVEKKGEASTFAPRGDDFQAPSFASDAGIAPKFEEVDGDEDLPF